MNDNWMIVYKVDICTVHNFEKRTLWKNILKASYLLGTTEKRKFGLKVPQKDTM